MGVYERSRQWWREAALLVHTAWMTSRQRRVDEQDDSPEYCDSLRRIFNSVCIWNSHRCWSYVGIRKKNWNPPKFPVEE